MDNIKVIAFDADDTLWVNEPHYQVTARKFCALLRDYMPEKAISEELFNTEIKNLSLYGYGAKSFMLSMIETLTHVCNGSANTKIVREVIDLGKEMLQKPVELLNGVKEVLVRLNGDYRLVVATKGDLLDQERKLQNSGLEKHFHHIEIMSDKRQKDYVKLLHNINCLPENFLMVGNSLKSDILPVLELGAYAIHIPFHTTWAYEDIKQEIKNRRFTKVKNITEIVEILRRYE